MDSSIDLTLAEYQRRAQQTDRIPTEDESGVDPKLVPLLGLAGEVGTLLAGYKKYLRDGSAYELFPDNVEEELGDILWYIANTADKFSLSLEQVAKSNLTKVTDRWHRAYEPTRKRDPEDYFDAHFNRREQLPRTFEVRILPDDGTDISARKRVHSAVRRLVSRQRRVTPAEPRVKIIWNGKEVGDRLGDNTYDDSGYRFHDVFHLANAAVLGWSPVARAKIFGCKRKSSPMTDSVEDGGRAIVIEEAIAAYMFAHARHHRFFDGIRSLDFHTLKTFRLFTSDLEVRARNLWEIEDAILQGFAAWRKLKEHGGGILRGSLEDCTLVYVDAARTS